MEHGGWKMEDEDGGWRIEDRDRGVGIDIDTDIDIDIGIYSMYIIYSLTGQDLQPCSHEGHGQAPYHSWPVDRAPDTGIAASVAGSSSRQLPKSCDRVASRRVPCASPT